MRRNEPVLPARVEAESNEPVISKCDKEVGEEGGDEGTALSDGATKETDGRRLSLESSSESTTKSTGPPTSLESKDPTIMKDEIILIQHLDRTALPIDENTIELAILSPTHLSTPTTLSLPPTRTTTSFFDSLTSSQRPILPRRSNSKTDPDKLRLHDLGYSEELGRSHDFWSSWSIGFCNIGALPGVFFGVVTALSTGGSSMYSIAFPLTGFFLCAMVAVIGEMASTYPVAGQSFLSGAFVHAYR